ncbi:N-6 DNA methylase [Campylobacter lari]|nr:N-6 DNA methylase [Campylobacter lari]
MINKENLKEVLESLGFEDKNEIYSKTINKYTLKVNFKDKILHYPKEVIIHDATTSNFSHPENFVVFECVHRLLEKGYKAEHLELEPKWNLGRDKKGGKADILIRDNENNPYLIIECKTTDSKNSEFAKEWARMQENGGQLFSYLQQERGTKYLCLYTSDFNTRLDYESYIIQTFDNEEYLKEKELEKSYQKVNNNIELFAVWKESYESHYFKQGIFESNINAYKILETTPIFDNLKELKEEGKYHEFAKILRKYNISGKENAFDKLVNIFLCKIYDETFNKDNLKFGYRGVMADTYASMQDRLMLLYKEAMREFLGEKITFVSNDDIEKDFKKLKIKALKEVMQNYIKELKFYSNNDFAFLEVHNKELFLKNALVLTEIIELFAPYKLTQNSTNQFLGNLFELFLQKGMKQDEGQFFTPIQICEFIMYSLPLDSMLKESTKPLKVIDYACGAGHFLNTYANELKRYIKEQDLKEHYKNIYGIEKEYRLSKVSKVSSAMYGQNEINILYADALSSFELANTKNLEGEKAKPQIESHSFDLLIANPPYSVKGFLETLSAKSKKTYSLFNNDINIETNNAIECFFCERANQILKDNAKAAIILPSSILNKDSIYKTTREILFQNFDFIAIVELGNQTFGATGTNTIILFLRKKETFRQENNFISQDYSLIKERIESENLKDNERFCQNYLSVYCDFRGFDKESYENFLNGNLDSNLFNLDIFKDYHNAFKQTSDYKKLKVSKAYKDSKEKDLLEKEAFLNYAQKIEKDKLLYFSLSLNQEVLIIKAPSDIKEQKKFLGYEWSNRKGDEGLKESHSPYFSPLFERDNPKNNSKLNTLIYKSFLNTLDSIPQDLSSYATQARLIDMIDFEKVEFNKAISLNPKTQRQEINSQYPLVKLETCGDFFMGGTPSRKNSSYWNGEIKWLTIGDYSNHQVITDTKEKITQQGFKDSNAKMIQKGAVVVSIYATIGRVGILGESMTTNQAIVSIIPNEWFINKYLMYAIDYFKFQLFNETITTSQKNINLGILQNMIIPKPPLEIQKQIVAECEKIEEQYNTIRMSIEEYQNLIKVVLQKSGIIDENGGGDELNSILENLQKLEPKIDFNFLFSLIEEQISHSKALVEESQNKKIEQDFNTFKDFSKTIQELLQTLPTPPQNGWKRVKIKDVGLLSAGGDKPKEFSEIKTQKFSIPVYANAVENKGLYGWTTKPIVAQKALTISARGTIGYAVARFEPFVPIVRLIVLTPNEKILNLKFVEVLINNSEIKNSGSNIPQLTIPEFSNYQIPLPPLKIQEKITQTIKAIEKQISFIDSKLALLEVKKEIILKKYLEKNNISD